MRIPINMGVKGRVTATLTNMETGEKQEVKGDNLILNHYMDWAMERGLGVLGSTTFYRCYIGTGDTPPQPGDTTFIGTQLAMSASRVLVKDLAPPSDHIEFIKSFPIGAGNVNQLALTPDNEILLVGNANATPTLKAFKIDKSDWSLTELAVPAFDIFDPELGAAAGLSCGGDYLFVGLNYAPWGKLFKRIGDDFLFISDVPELSRYARFSDISSNGKYLVVCGDRFNTSSGENVWVYKILEDGSLVGISHDITGECSSAKFSPDSSRLAVANYRSLALYRVADSGLERYYSRATSSDAYTNAYARSVCWLANNRVAWFESFSSSSALAVIAVDEGEGGVSTMTWSNIVGEYVGSITSFSNGVIIESGGHGVFYQRVNHLRRLETGIDSIQQSRSASIAVDDDSKTMFVRQNGISLYKLRSARSDTLGYACRWTFPAGVGTGTVNRVGLQANSSTGAGGNDRHVAQIVLPEAMEKTDLHQLDVIWEIEVENPGVWEGVIPGGSRDGSDLAWRVTINEEQFFALVSTGYSISANWFGVTGTPNVRIGTSNEESDLIFDRENIRGKQIQYISSTAIREVNPYVPGSLKRTIRLFLEVDQGNGQIGEIVLGGSTSTNSLARITFDPPLDKPPDVGEGANPYRIYLDLEIGWQRGESDA